MCHGLIQYVGVRKFWFFTKNATILSFFESSTLTQNNMWIHLMHHIKHVSKFYKNKKALLPKYDNKTWGLKRLAVSSPDEEIFKRNTTLKFVSSARKLHWISQKCKITDLSSSFYIELKDFWEIWGKTLIGLSLNLEGSQIFWGKLNQWFSWKLVFKWDFSSIQLFKTQKWWKVAKTFKICR